ncbi:MAG TPA: alkaline phosphatase [Chitinispirillaceae bacterium]|nr:alkaline phosphatase [Chitinispirillaceae bacterium]
MSFSFKKTIAVVALLFQSAIAITADGKNIILLIPDGCGISHQTLARWYKGTPLASDQLSSGLCITNSGNSMITGSAAAATAIATGHKTWEQEKSAKCVGILPDSLVFPTPRKLPADLQWRPVATVLEAARLCGKSTGLVATARISHATPAAFSSHWHDRDNENVIIKQQVYQNIDVVFGGGMRYLLPDSMARGARTDEENLQTVLTANGYNVITKRSQLKAISSNTRKIWGLFNTDHMCADINRPYFGKDEPSLAEMTRAAISILSRNSKGFFLMVEGSQVDFASHNNDPVGVVTEYMAFDSAVQIAVDFAKKNKNTIVMVFPDHDNGGLSLGDRGDTYTDMPASKVLTPLKKSRITAAGLLDTLIVSQKSIAIDFSFAASALNSFMGINSLSTQDSSDIKKLLSSVASGTKSNQDVASVGRIISRRSSLGWTTYGHCGTNVWIYGMGVNFDSIIDNTEIAGICFKNIGVSADSISRLLFQEVRELFGKFKEITIIIDSSDAKNGKGKVTVSTPDKSAVFPFFKNEILLRNGKKLLMEGITVYSEKSGKVYLPMQALKLFNKG